MFSYSSTSLFWSLLAGLLPGNLQVPQWEQHTHHHNPGHEDMDKEWPYTKHGYCFRPILYASAVYASSVQSFTEPLFRQGMIHEPNKQTFTLAKPSLFLHLWSQATLGEAVLISHPPHIVGEQGHMLPTHWPDWHGRQTVFWGGMRSSCTCTLGSWTRCGAYPHSLVRL